MSFQSVEVAAESSNTKPGRQWRDSKSEFERDIMDNVQQMQESARRAENTLQMASRNFLAKAMDVGLAKDLKKCEQLRQQTEQTFRDWTVHMAGEPMERHRKRFACDKLRKAFDEEIACLRDLERRAHMARHIASKHTDRDEELGLCEPAETDASPANRTADSISSALIHCHQEVNMESEVISQREEGIKRIQTQMASVNQIFRDLASIVTEQGRQMETIEQHAEESGVNSKQATEELQKACKRQDSVAHLWFFILAVTLFVCLSILMHMSAASPAAAAGAVVIGEGHGVGTAGAAQANGFATGFGTRVMATGN